MPHPKGSSKKVVKRRILLSKCPTSSNEDLKKAKIGATTPSFPAPATSLFRTLSPVINKSPPPPVSEDNFSDADMVESDLDDSFTMPPPSAEDYSVDERSSDFLPVSTASRALSPRSGLLAEASATSPGPGPRPATCPSTRPSVSETSAKPRPRRHPAFQKARPTRDPNLVTILLKPSKPDDSLHSIGYPTFARALKKLHPEPVSCRRIRGHGYAIDFPPGTPTGPLLQLTSIAGVSVTSSLPAARPARSGTIRGPYGSPEEVHELYSLHESNPPIKNVERIGKTDVFRLHFSSGPLPSSVTIFYNKHRVSPFFQSPVRCYNCQRHNHVAKHCRSRLTCGKCAEPGHVYKDCPATIIVCPNCGGQHHSADRNCKHWQYELQVRKLQAREDIPLPQARATTARSYADALQSRQSCPRQVNIQKPRKEAPSTPTPLITAETIIRLISKMLEICSSNHGNPECIQAQVGTLQTSSLGLPSPTCQGK